MISNIVDIQGSSEANVNKAMEIYFNLLHDRWSIIMSVRRLKDWYSFILLFLTNESLCNDILVDTTYIIIDLRKTT